MSGNPNWNQPHGQQQQFPPRPLFPPPHQRSNGTVSPPAGPSQPRPPQSRVTSPMENYSLASTPRSNPSPAPHGVSGAPQYSPFAGVPTSQAPYGSVPNTPPRPPVYARPPPRPMHATLPHLAGSNPSPAQQQVRPPPHHLPLSQHSRSASPAIGMPPNRPPMPPPPHSGLPQQANVSSPPVSGRYQQPHAQPTGQQQLPIQQNPSVAQPTSFVPGMPPTSRAYSPSSQQNSAISQGIAVDKSASNRRRMYPQEISSAYIQGQTPHVSNFATPPVASTKYSAPNSLAAAPSLDQGFFVPGQPVQQVPNQSPNSVAPALPQQQHYGGYNAPPQQQPYSQTNPADMSQVSTQMGAMSLNQQAQVRPDYNLLAAISVPIILILIFTAFI